MPSLDHEQQDDEPQEGSLRRCIVTGERRHPDHLIRFVVGPDGTVVADVEERLPGRGLWLSADRDVVNTACAKGLFARAARKKVVIPEAFKGLGMADAIEARLVRRCLDLLGLARRAGQAVAGFEKVRVMLRAGGAGVLLAAGDGARDGRRKVRALAEALAPNLPLVEALTGDELASAFGREHVVHAAMAPGGLAERLVREGRRLSGFRDFPAMEGAQDDDGSGDKPDRGNENAN